MSAWVGGLWEGNKFVTSLLPTLQLSMHKLCHCRDPNVAWILLEKENLSDFPEAGLYKKLTEPSCHIMLSCFSEWHLISSLLLWDSHTFFLCRVWRGSSTTLFHHRFSATLADECFLHTVCTISDEMVFAKQGHKHRNTPTLPPSGSHFPASPTYS